MDNTEIVVWIPCDPAGRPRVDHRPVKTKTGRVMAIAYVPDNPQRAAPGKRGTKNAVGWIKAHAFRRAVREAVRSSLPETPWDGPVMVDLDFYFPRPERLLKRSSPTSRVPYAAKPDRDNLDKALLDALTARAPNPRTRGPDADGYPGLWVDDAQVCDGRIGKWYVPLGGEPGVLMTARRLPVC